LWRDYSLTIIMVTHDIREAFTLGTRLIALDKRRIDPHAPHRFGASAVYDLPLKRNKGSLEEEVITADIIQENETRIGYE